MNPGGVVLARLPEPGGLPPKLRPALVLAPLPGPYQDHLLCGISTRWQTILTDWDEVIQPGDPDFVSSGLHRLSVIRLSFLYATVSSELTGLIGSIGSDRLQRHLADHLRSLTTKP